MKSTIIVASVLASLALAGPVKRAIVTEWEYQTITVTVTAAKGLHPTAAANHSQAPSRVQQATTATSTTSTTSIGSIAPTSSSSAISSAVNVDYSALSDYARPIVEQHNIHRSNHSAPALVWDDELANVAKQIAETCVYAHSRAFGDGDYGQNIGAGAPPTDIPKMITNSMYNGEINAYPGYGGEPDLSKFEVWGHFSQIVWMNTKSVGCYTAHCAHLQNVGSNVAPYFTVCNYKPSGNYGGQYGKNVLAPLGEKAVIL